VSRALPAWLVVGRREFMVRVRSKWFIVVTLLGPIGMLALILVPAYLSKKSAEQAITLQCIDHTPEQVSDEFVNRNKLEELSQIDPNAPREEIERQVLQQTFDIERVPPDTPREELEARILHRKIDGYMILPEDLLDGGKVLYRGANVSNLALMGSLRGYVGGVVRGYRARRAGLTDEQIAALTKSIELETELTTGKGETASGEASYVVGYIVMFVLYMSILLYAVNVMRSVVEEKTSRVVEIMVSSIKPAPLMLGKILGVGSAGLVQLGAWAVMAFLIFQYRAALLGLVGVAGGGAIDFPVLGAGAVVVVMLYFLLGYFFYAALYAAIGAMVNSEQEAQQLQTPVVMLLIIPVVCVQLIANDPRGGAAELLTLIPFSSPVLMPMRYLLGGATTGDIVLSVGLLVAALAAVIWIAARIYRVGILMHGKRPSLRELARWIRH